MQHTPKPLASSRPRAWVNTKLQYFALDWSSWISAAQNVFLTKPFQTYNKLNQPYFSLTKMQGLYKKFSTWHSMVGTCFETPSCIFQTFEPCLNEIDIHQEQNLSLRANKRDSASDIVIQTFIIKWWLLGRADSFYFNDGLNHFRISLRENKKSSAAVV